MPPSPWMKTPFVFGSIFGFSVLFHWCLFLSSIKTVVDFAHAWVLLSKNIIFLLTQKSKLYKAQRTQAFGARPSRIQVWPSGTGLWALRARVHTWHALLGSWLGRNALYAQKSSSWPSSIDEGPYLGAKSDFIPNSGYLTTRWLVFPCLSSYSVTSCYNVTGVDSSGCGRRWT